VTVDDFKRSLSQSTPPSGLTPALLALWHDGRGDWQEAHRIAQDITGRTGAWIHAYLHRKEGDLSNASYWYRVAQKALEDGEYADEWSTILDELLAE
jgi:hypothetical protein